MTQLDQRSPPHTVFFQVRSAKNLFYVKMIQYDKVTTLISYKFLNILLNFDPVGPEVPPHSAFFQVRSAKKIILRKNDPVRQSYNFYFIQIFEYFIKVMTQLDQRSPRTRHFFKWDLQILFYVKMIQYNHVTIWISYKFWIIY